MAAGSSDGVDPEVGRQENLSGESVESPSDPDTAVPIADQADGAENDADELVEQDGQGGVASGEDPASNDIATCDVVVDVEQLADAGQDEGAVDAGATVSVARSARASDARTTVGNAMETQPDTALSSDFKTMAKIAIENARHNRLAGGSMSVFNVKMRHFGELGIGFQLYFMLTKYLGVTFFVMGLVALPAIILNKYGHGITSKMVDPLQLAYASLGNQGVNSQIANNTMMCLPLGNIDCTGETVTTPFTTDPYRVTWILTLSDCSYSVLFALFCVFYWRRVRSAIDLHLTENLTPAKYAVFVRGLPPDATEGEILKHFNGLFDPTTRDQYFPLWFGCCWGRRQKVRNSRLPVPINSTVVSNLDHLKGTKRSENAKMMYMNSWIAEVSVAHPTGGLLRAFLSMEALTQSIAETETLIETLKKEKAASPSTFHPRDEKLILSSTKKLKKLELRLEKATRSIKQLRDVLPAKSKKNASSDKLERKMRESEQAVTQKQALQRRASSTRAKMKEAAKAAKKAATKTQRAFNWDGCESSFVVFNNLESRRRCLRDYRMSGNWLLRHFQPGLLRFRGKHPLIVCEAPEPSNIIWENLEVTDRGRFYRQSFTNFVTFILLLASAIVISAAQSAQQDFQNKMPPDGLCDTSLPQVFYGNSSYQSQRKLKWDLEWDSTATCPSDGKTLYHIAYSNGIINDFTFTPSYGPSNPSPVRCTDPCVSETSNEVCSTLPCFNYQSLVIEGGQTCETYLASHVLYCYCSSALTESMAQYGYVNGAKKLWNEYVPCRAFIKDYSLKNAYIVVAAAVVVIVNLLLKMIIHALAAFERHSSESAKMLAIALKTFGAQLLNTAIIVLFVNASLGLSSVPVVKELFKGKYRDFEREWYPSVGMGITTTMLINAIMPQLTLCLQMFVVAPLMRWISRRSIRTQQQMNRLYAGPDFDMSVRYPMVLNSVFVTMMFAGGSPILLFIAALTSTATFWLDKMSLLHLYSVRTAYDEELGEVALRALPWTLALHFGFSAWMYGNTDLMKANLVDLRLVLKSVGLSSLVRANPNATSNDLYSLLLKKAASFDALGKYGLIVKLVRTHVMLMSILFAATVVCILLSTILLPVVLAAAAVVVKGLNRFIQFVLGLVGRVFSVATACLTRSKEKRKRNYVAAPEFTAVFRKSVRRSFWPERAQGFYMEEVEGDGDMKPHVELFCVFREDTVIQGIKRKADTRKLTWEAMRAPVKSYSIEMNSRYILAVKQVEEAWAAIKRSDSLLSGKIAPINDQQEAAAVESLVTATEPTVPIAETGNDLIEGVATEGGIEEANRLPALAEVGNERPSSDDSTNEQIPGTDNQSDPVEASDGRLAPAEESRQS